MCRGKQFTHMVSSFSEHFHSLPGSSQYPNRRVIVSSFLDLIPAVKMKGGGGRRDRASRGGTQVLPRVDLLLHQYRGFIHLLLLLLRHGSR